MSVEIQIPSILKLGAGSFAEVPAVLARLGGKRPLIVTDAFLMSRGLPQKLQTLIQETGIECGIFCETVPDPQLKPLP
jgi:alcohol dehydrogenase class IV